MPNPIATIQAMRSLPIDATYRGQENILGQTYDKSNHAVGIAANPIALTR